MEAVQYDDDKMFLQERQQRILEFLSSSNRATVAELSHLFKVGEATIRRDLSDLQAKGLVRRTHGGAILTYNANEETALQERATQNKEEKGRIAAAVAQLIHSGETLMIDGGSTTLQIARHLRAKSDIGVITNSLAIANVLCEGSCRTILTGGELQPMTHVMIGPMAEYTLRQFRADWVILGMSGMLPQEGLFTVNSYEAELKRTMMRCGKEVVIAMDSSKIGRVTFSFVAELSGIDMLVTDSGIAKEVKEEVDATGVEIVIV